MNEGADNNKMFSAERNHATQGAWLGALVKLIHRVSSGEIEVKMFPYHTASSLVGKRIVDTGPNLGPIQKPKIILPFESRMM